MIYVTGIIIIIIAVVDIIATIKYKDMDYRLNCVILLITMIAIIIFLMFGYKGEKIKLNYIENLETKLNIYEESYDNYCLEDALKQ